MEQKRMENNERVVPVEIAMDVFEKKVIRIIKESELPAVLVSLELEKIKAAVDEEAERRLQKLYANMKTTLTDEAQGMDETQDGIRDEGERR